MKANQIQVGKTYRGRDGTRLRTVTKIWALNDLRASWMVDYDFPEFNESTRNTISLAAFARWAVEEVAE